MKITSPDQILDAMAFYREFIDEISIHVASGRPLRVEGSDEVVAEIQNWAKLTEGTPLADAWHDIELDFKALVVEGAANGRRLN